MSWDVLKKGLTKGAMWVSGLLLFLIGIIATTESATIGGIMILVGLGLLAGAKFG